MEEGPKSSNSTKTRRSQKLRVINNYPKTENGKRKVSQLRKAAFSKLGAKANINYFLALSDMGNDWDYTTDKIRKTTGLTFSQISKAKHELIRIGVIKIDDEADTLTIDYETLFAGDEKRKICKSTYYKPEKLNIEFEDEECFPDCLGGGPIVKCDRGY